MKVKKLNINQILRRLRAGIDGSVCAIGDHDFGSKIKASATNKYISLFRSPRRPIENFEIFEKLTTLKNASDAKFCKLLLSPELAPLWTVDGAAISPIKNEFADLLFGFE